MSRSALPLRPLAVLLVAALSIAFGPGRLSVAAAELVMYDKPGCVWCVRWERDIGRAYPRSAESRAAPLRRVDIQDQRRSGVELAEPVVYTPTFVVADDDGVEIGRITGYRGAEDFWAQLEALLHEERRYR